jgi:hypothetical protein
VKEDLESSVPGVSVIINPEKVSRIFQLSLSLPCHGFE